MTITRTDLPDIRVPHVWLRTFTALVSVLIGALGVWWLAHPSAYPFHPEDPRNDISLLALQPSSVVSAILAVLGLGGAVVAIAGHARRWPRPVIIALVAWGIVEIIGVGLLAPDAGVLAILGYLTALVGPLAALVALGIAAWRRPALRVVLVAVVAGIIAWTWWAGVLDVDAMSRLGKGLVSGFANLGVRPLYLVLFVATGVLWLGWTVAFRRHSTGHCVHCGRSAPTDGVPGWVVRWGRPITILAACGPLPYVLVRMTWLTPWQLGGMGAELDAQPEMRLWGLLLGASALGGIVLTIGLIRPWGEVFPSWIPVIGGRVVPVKAAVIPASLVAAAVTVAAPSMVLHPIQGETSELWMLIGLQFWIWGPALAVATWAYWLRRRGQCASCAPVGGG